MTPSATKTRPLDAGLWAGAVDNVGGTFLPGLTSTMEAGGYGISSAQSIQLPTTVFPSSCAVSAIKHRFGYMGFPTRARVWERLATDLKPAPGRHDPQRAFAELPGVFDDFIAGRVKGRTVIAVNG